MEVNRDFKELLELFNARNVEYAIVGGYAVGFHGSPRYTGDLDIYVRPSADNAQKIMAALTDFGFGDAGIAREDFLLPGKVVQMGVPPNRIDVMCTVDGVSWEQVEPNRVKGSYGDVQVSFIGRTELMANKRAVGRKKDLADLEALEPNGRFG